MLAVAAVLLACGRPRPAPGTQPNLVLIVADALRQSNLSLYGASRPTTPRLDALAPESWVFDRAIAAGGNTTTVMPAMMTGHYAFFSFDEEWTSAAFGMRRFYRDPSETGLPRDLETLAEKLQKAGYATGGFITNPYLKREFEFHRGFDVYREIFREKGIPYGRGEEVSRAAIEFLRAEPTRRPFFAYLHFMDTHGPYWPPDPYRTRFGADVHGFDERFAEVWPRWEKAWDPAAPDAAALAERLRDLYDGAVAYVDHCVGEVLDALAAAGTLDETVVAFTADHGDEFLEHGGTTHKGTLFEELVRVPLLIRIPGKPPGRTSDLVRNFDLHATLLELAGIGAAGQGLDAVSLLPLIDRHVASLRLTAYAGFPTIRMLRTPRYKLLRFRDGRQQFFDLERDPGERRDLYPEIASGSAAGKAYADTLAGLAAALDRRVAALLAGARPGGPAPPPEVDAKTREQLEALGYVD